MKTLKKCLFPILLIAACFTVHYWQHAIASLPYLPMNCVVPLATLTPVLLILTFFATFVLLKQTGDSKPVRRSLLSTAAMFAIMLATGVYYLSFLTYRFAAAMPPVPVLPDWPTGIVTMIITFLCLAHLTGLLVCGFVKRKTPAKLAIPAAVGWILLNACLWLVTT